MSFPLNNVTTADNYTVANTLQDTAPCVLADIHVFNAAIFYSIQIDYEGTPRGESFGAEVFLAPGLYSFPRKCTGIKVRSATAGKPAQVTANLIPDSELPG